MIRIEPAVYWDDEARPHWRHDCLGRPIETQLPLGSDRWQKGDGDTITPSINCFACGTHGWWTNGQWWWCGLPRPVADHLATDHDETRHGREQGE